MARKSDLENGDSPPSQAVITKTGSVVLFSERVPKLSGKGREVGNWMIERQSFEGHEYVMVTQTKNAFTDNQNPGKSKPVRTSFITLDVGNQALVEALATALKTQ